jgi:hypothetical protein
MKRRGFLGLLGFAAAPVSVAVANGRPRAEENGIVFECDCPVCKAHLAQFVDLSGPVTVGTQCPHCLAVLDLTGLSDKIFERQGRDRYGRKVS